MKQKHGLNLIHTPLIALALTAGTALAGPTETIAPVTPAPSSDVVSGVLSLDLNTHFVSYGADVWGDGDSMSEPTFNPSLELSFALPAGFTATLGTWWDVNSKDGGNSSPIGGRVQEIDVWYGLSYTIDKFTVGVVYNQWFYSSETEDSIDVVLSYDTFLSPSLTIHNRIDEGASGGDNGTVLVLGLSHSIEAGPVTISFPFNIAYFATDDFHGGDDGLGYASIGVTASYPLEFLKSIGDWSINGGLTYYVTDQEVIPGNVEGDFLTANVGLSLEF
ncbi:MAG: hypothetical protein QM627_01115 [Luteolibacter sp.]